MNFRDVLSYIAKRNIELLRLMQNCMINDDEWNKLKGAFDELEKLRMHILILANYHNRQDIKKLLEKDDSKNGN